MWIICEYWYFFTAHRRFDSKNCLFLIFTCFTWFKKYAPHKKYGNLTLQKKIKFSIKDFLSKCDQIRKKLRILSHLLKKSLILFVQCNSKSWCGNFVETHSFRVVEFWQLNWNSTEIVGFHKISQQKIRWKTVFNAVAMVNRYLYLVQFHIAGAAFFTLYLLNL